MSLALGVRNDGHTTWPALGATAHGLVTLGYRWRDTAGDVAARADAGRIPWDLAPGEEVVGHVVLAPPPRDVRPERLEIGLVQDGRWFDDPIVRCFDASGAGIGCPG
jgi:hypothetical protein